MAALDDAMREREVVRSLTDKALDAETCLDIPGLTDDLVDWLKARRNAALDELVARGALTHYTLA